MTWGSLFYSLDEGANFEEIILPDEMTHSVNYKLALSPVNEDEIWVSDNNPGGIWRTVDNGATWEKLDKGLTFANWEGNVEAHSIGRFFLTGNEKNAAYAIAFTIGYLNETYSTTRGRVLYRDDTTDGWVDYSDGLQKVMNLNRMLPFYKEGVIRLATNNGIWERPLVDSVFLPIAQPLILNVGSGDNTQSDGPRNIRLESYSIVNQKDAQWRWKIEPNPLSMGSVELRNPTMLIAPDQTYNITLTVTTPAGSSTKTVKGMIKGSKPAYDSVPVEEVYGGKDIMLTSGNVVNAGDNFVFVPGNIDGALDVTVYNSVGEVMFHSAATGTVAVPTGDFRPAVYFYMATDAAGFKKTGKLLVKE
jgi:hypothetical protein